MVHAMFPLGTVLLPGMPLSLRIFEPRYVAMMSGVLTEDPAEFGVVLIERGHEVGGGDSRFDVGTLAHIEHVQTIGRRIRMVAVGTRRFRVLRWLADEPYPRAEIALVDELLWDTALDDTLAQTDRAVRSAMSRAAEFVDIRMPAESAWSEDPIERCWQLATVAPVGPLDRIDFLRSINAAELLARIADTTAAAIDTLIFGATSAPPPDTA